jgi:type 1 glutamine amidotransferase
VMAVTDDTMLVVTEVAPYADGPAGVHGVLGQAGTALAELAAMAGLRPEVVPHVASLAADRLARGGVLALFTIGETPFDPEQRRAVEEAWRAGRLKILGVHSATDACHGWPAYGDLLGARFDGHPWTQPFDVEVVDGGHPATAHLGATWSWRDEVYLFRDLRPDARVLLRLAPGQLDMSAPGARTPACGFPLAWCVTGGSDGGDGGDGAGRTFYTALGHFPGAWETPAYLRHLAGGLAWLLEGGAAA